MEIPTKESPDIIKYANEARDKTFEVHVNGKAVVYTGELKDCLIVSGILEEILLHTQIET